MHGNESTEPHTERREYNRDIVCEINTKIYKLCSFSVLSHACASLKCNVSFRTAVLNAKKALRTPCKYDFLIRFAKLQPWEMRSNRTAAPLQHDHTLCLCQNTPFCAGPDRSAAGCAITHSLTKGAVNSMCFSLRQISPCLRDFLWPKELTCEAGKEKWWRTNNHWIIYLF